MNNISHTFLSSYLENNEVVLCNLFSLNALQRNFLYLSGLTESLFLAYKDEYPEHEQASLRQLWQAKVLFFPVLSY